eukprot:scaffold1282_cov251-Pinguiococcus_pyrenoidosus.AAC.53
MKKRLRVVEAARTLAAFLDGLQLLRALVPLQLQMPRGPIHQRHAESRRPRGVDAVKHVHAEADADHEVQRVANPHEIPRLVRRQALGAVVHHPPELVLVLPARQASDRVAGQIPRDHVAQAPLAHAPWSHVQAPLDDGEQALLLLSLVRLNAAIQPAHRAVAGLFEARLVVADGAHHVVQLHDDVRPDVVLVADGVLRPQLHLRAGVVGAPERHALLVHAHEVAEADHLEAAAVREQVPLPMHEAVEAAEVAQQLRAGLQRQVLARTQRLDAALGAHRHEHRRRHFAMWQPQRGRAAPAARQGMQPETQRRASRRVGRRRALRHQGVAHGALAVPLAIVPGLTGL